ncbi:amino acid permease [Sinanaerobacter chloroacetimidivorans]|jgi:AAT family amino acid transporter|uniref:Amino acid permease n=1 Tax=Sinanaerobacter chloroacetimidivorans TaxID=2818044 RepID=A0A8J7VYR7_9FIRM|nr:amino acid permease [Sinanaerobacter chloroacetimidivorans]MBR0597602.1 amino acid permease [Sinanaerobacter chloroacetimidivorans]
MTEQGKNNVEKSERTLSRGIMPWHVSLIALGGIIGSCYFLGLGLTFSEMGPGAVLIAYAIAGLTIYGVMQSFAELLVNIPRRGSFVSYTREFMGDTASAGIGWAFWANWVAYVPSEALATAVFMNYFITLPFENEAWSTFVWGVVALALLTAVNLYHVKWFGHIESVMAIIKILAIAVFVLCAVGIWMGVIGGNLHPFTDGSGFIGSQILLGGGEGSIVEKLFPAGGFIIITYMIWTLVNFQGSEIVGLSAAETQDPATNVPLACRRVAFRIILIYLIPVFTLTLVVPYAEAGLDESIFAYTLGAYGLRWAAGLFTIVTLVAAFSCANSGLYGTVRALYGLSVEGMAPKFLSNLNRFNTPQNATIFTIIPIWLVFLLGFASDELGLWGANGLPLYANLLGISGFTGTLCWVGICWSQVTFRKKLKERGYDPNEVLTVKAKWYPGLAYFAIALQVGAMILLVFEDGGMPVFIISLIAIFLPITVYALQKKRGKIRTVVTLGSDEVTFDEKFPIKN